MPTSFSLHINHAESIRKVSELWYQFPQHIVGLPEKLLLESRLRIIRVACSSLSTVISFLTSLRENRGQTRRSPSFSPLSARFFLVLCVSWLVLLA